MLKVSAFYLEKQKSFIPKNNIFQAVVSKYAKIDSKDGAYCPNFQWRFWWVQATFASFQVTYFTVGQLPFDKTLS